MNENVITEYKTKINDEASSPPRGTATLPTDAD